MAMMDRYIMHMCIADWSDVAWLPSFNEVGIAIFEMSANELHNIKVSVPRLNIQMLSHPD